MEKKYFCVKASTKENKDQIEGYKVFLMCDTYYCPSIVIFHALHGTEISINYLLDF